MVATLGKVSSAKDSADYYIHSQASHRPAQEYYIAGEEPDGIWYNPHGMFGLADGDKVLADAFYTLHSGFEPTNPPFSWTPNAKRKLTQNAGNDNRTAAFDLTFSADKTVSAVWAMAAGNDQAEIAKAHDDAVRSALDLIIKEHCSWTRHRPDSDADMQVMAAKLMAATFQHQSSRAGDPQLHTHAVIFNFTEGEDGKYRALHAQPLYAWMRTAGAVYRSALAYNLRQLGFDTERHGRKGEMIRIKGDLDEIVHVWSKRRRAIVAASRLLGFTTADNPALAERINKRTRDSKEKGVDPLAKSLRWDLESNAIYEDVDGFIESLRTHTALKQGDPVLHELVHELRAIPDTLTENEAVWKITDVMREVALVTAGVIKPGSIAQVTEAVLQYAEVVELDRWGDGPNVQADLAHTRVFSTPAQIERERNIRHLAASLYVQPAEPIPEELVEEHLIQLEASGYPLSDEQAAAIRRACTGQRNLIIEGAAGSGKSTTLLPIADIAREAGWKVYGTANAWRTANELGDECRIPTWCVKTVLNRYRNGTLEFDDRSLILVDEAGQLSVRQAEALLTISGQTGARILWAGDTRQQQPIEAGPGLRLIRDIIGSVEVKTIRRQRADAEDILVQVYELDEEDARAALADMTAERALEIVAAYRALDDPPAVKPWQIAASEALRDKKTDEAIAAYAARNRIHLADDLEDTLRTLVDDWDQHRNDAPDESRLVIARTHAELGALTPVLRERSLTKEQLQQESPLTVAGDYTDRKQTRPKSLLVAPGDQLVVRANCRDLGFVNGTLLTVTAIANVEDEDGTSRITLSARTADGRDVSFEPDQVRHWDPDRGLHGLPCLDYGYAITFSSAQGDTVDRAFVLADDRPAIETIYPALTRHRDRLDIYCNTAPIRLNISDDRPEAEDDNDVTDAQVLERLAKAWKRSDPKRAALDHILDPETRKHGYQVAEDADEEEKLAKSDHAKLLRPAAPDSVSALQWLRSHRRQSEQSPFLDDILRMVRADQTTRNHTRDLDELAERIRAVSESYRMLTEEARDPGGERPVWRSEEYAEAVHEHRILVPLARRALARFTKFPGIMKCAARAGLTREVLQEWIRDYESHSHTLRSAASTPEPAEYRSLHALQFQWTHILDAAAGRGVLPIYVPGWQQALQDISAAVRAEALPAHHLPAFNAILQEQRIALRIDRQARSTIELIRKAPDHLRAIRDATENPLDPSIDWPALARPVEALEEAVAGLPPPAEIDPYLKHYHPEAAPGLPKLAASLSRKALESALSQRQDLIARAAGAITTLHLTATALHREFQASFPRLGRDFCIRFETAVNELAEAANQVPRNSPVAQHLAQHGETSLPAIHASLSGLRGAVEQADLLINPHRKVRLGSQPSLPPAPDPKTRQQGGTRQGITTSTEESRKKTNDRTQGGGGLTA